MAEPAAEPAVDWRLLDQKNQQRFIADLQQAGVILKGHFITRFGLHSDTFIDIKGLYPHTRITKNFGRALAHRIQRELGYEHIQQISGVVAPAIGGIILAHDTADWIGRSCQEFDREVLALFTEKSPKDGTFYFGRGYDELINGKHWVIVEDVTTTGSAIRELIDLVTKLGGFVDLACLIWNRSNITSEDIRGVPLASLINHSLSVYSPDQCHLCTTEQPINTKHGRGAEYVSEHGQFSAAS